MKYLNIKSIVLTTLFSTVFNVMSLYARKRPPAPFEGIDDSVRVGSPIDDYIPLLFMASIVLGVWALNKFKQQETTA